MEPTKRILLNSMVQYVRTFVNMLIMLVSTRLLVQSLGQSDYGLYSVVGSTVFMIGFVTVSLASSTQRFLSVSHGKGDMLELRSIFSNAIYLHLAISLVIVAVMGAAGRWFVDGLSIAPNRYGAASFMYFMMLLMMVFTFVTAPLRALYIARENIVYVSLVEILDAFLKLAGTVALPYIPYDSVMAYSVVMLMVSVFNMLAYASYALWKYEECHIPLPGEVKKGEMRKLMGFAVWNVYAVGSGVVRVQGLAVVINHFLGTLLNAAYGIALQVYNAVSFIALSIINSMNPQLMKAEGAGDRDRMLMLSTKESKYSFLVLSLVLIPLIFEIPGVLQFWLGDNVPDHAVMFCQFVLTAYIWDQTTIGLTSANQAIGQIRNYSLLISTTRLMVLPIAWYCLKWGLPVYSVMVGYLAIDVMIGFMRIPFLKATGGLNVYGYCKDVYLRCAVPTLGIVAVAWLMTHVVVSFPFRFVLTEVAAVMVGVLLIYVCALTPGERDWVTSKIRRKR